jgi:hypothetical protein
MSDVKDAPPDHDPTPVTLHRGFRIIPGMNWLVSLYDRRIVNVNVNVIVAGLLAMGITVLVMHLAEAAGLLAALQGRVPNITFPWRGGTGHIYGQKLVISGLTLGVDSLADILVYFGLHWFANHMPRKRIPRVRPEYQDLTFVRDATLVQFERAVLSPLLYFIALGTQNLLLHQGWSVESATAIGLGLGMVTARMLHTLWMLRQERRRKAASATATDPAKAHGGRAQVGERERASV